MQPGCRIKGNEWPLLRPSVAEESWTELMKGGQNGFLLVLLSLSWWLGATKLEKDRKDCLAAVDDVNWVLQQLIEVMRERQEPENSEDEDEKRPYKKYDIGSSNYLLQCH